MPEKIAIATLNYGYNKNLWYKYMRDMYIPSIRSYSKRINADFILMNNNNDRFIDTWNQLQFIEYLNYYDRVMYIDGDCYIPKYFNYNFFNNVTKNNIGLYQNIVPEVLECKYTFVIMILDNFSKKYFTPPPVNEQKHKWENISEYVCLMGKPIKDSCYQREECYINECINRYKLHDKITKLEIVLKIKTSYLSVLTQSMVFDKSNKYIYHAKNSERCVFFQNKLNKNLMNVLTNRKWKN